MSVITPEILQLLLDYHAEAFPDQALDWKKVIETILDLPSYKLVSMTRFDMIRYFLDVQKTHYSNQKVDFNALLEKKSKNGMSPEILQLIVDYHAQAFADQPLDWERIISTNLEHDSIEILQCMVQLSISSRLDGFRTLAVENHESY